jgi:dipeptidase E
VPYALHDLDAYAARLREIVGGWGLALESVHERGDPRAAVEGAEALLVGGGNTFRLLARLYEHGLLEPIRRRVRAGVPYLGTSAGSNVACPTIMTTNDMPIVMPPRFDALGLVPFQINPHYLDPDPTSTHRGETREQRLREYHEMNARPVIGLREGSFLLRDGPTLRLEGTVGARLFRRGLEPTEHGPGERLDDLLAEAPSA